MPTLDELYNQVRERSGGDTGDAFSETELIRQRRPQRSVGLDIPEEQMVPLNRYAQSYDTPLTGLGAGLYEGLKYGQQESGIPMLTGAAKLANAVGIPLAPPRTGRTGVATSPASKANVIASMKGALARVRDSLIPNYYPGDLNRIKRTYSSLPKENPGSVILGGPMGEAVHVPRSGGTKLRKEDIDYEK